MKLFQLENKEPNMQEFLNENLKPYNALTREEKHTLLDAMKMVGLKQKNLMISPTGCIAQSQKSTRN